MLIFPMEFWRSTRHRVQDTGSEIWGLLERLPSTVQSRPLLPLFRMQGHETSESPSMRKCNNSRKKEKKRKKAEERKEGRRKKRNRQMCISLIRSAIKNSSTKSKNKFN